MAWKSIIIVIRKRARWMISNSSEDAVKVKSIYRAGSKIPESLLALGNTPSSQFHIPWGTVYMVYGMCLLKDVIKYLIIEDGIYRPDWFPTIFFEVIDNRLPLDWHYSFWGKDSQAQVQAVWGYAELNDGGTHFDALMEREPEALRLFEQRRTEMDQLS